MFKKLCLLTVLMAMVAITANVAEARVITENFSGDGDRNLDSKGPGNETTQTLNSELTWGGYNAYQTTNTRIPLVRVSGTLSFEGRVIGESSGSYGYTMFETLNMTGTNIDFEAENNETLAGFETSIKLLLRAGGTWYLSNDIVEILDIEDSERRPYSFDPATATWDELDKTTNLMLDALADGDETDVNGLGTSVTLDTELADVTGGGFL
ncbi:MAG: hypothetical protein KAR47_07495, partial [Planctomycetes bacterium]|nr:hypothetical protein [Planctomycetota bacterium]